MAYESENDLVAAREAFVQAQRAYPLSPEVAWRFGNFLLRQGEMDSAFAEIRRAVQVDPQRSAAAFALCTRVVPDVSVVLDRVLPPSPEAYLSVVEALAERQHSDEALLVWSRLIALHPRLRLTDANELIEALLHKNQMPAAERVWQQVIAASDTARPPDPPESLVWDGGFESNVVNAGLAWRYAPLVDDVQVARDTQEKHSGSYSLRLTFNGLRNVDLHDLCQFVAVQPASRYHFSAWVRTRSISTDQGLRFSLQAISEADHTVAFTEDVRGTQPWTQVQLLWPTAANVHELQLCITRQPSTKFDSKIHGTAWVDDVVLVPEARERPAQ